MTTKIPNNEKILIVLKHIDKKISSSDLAEYCHINPKNIGRYLDVLADKKLISRKTIQNGKKRYIDNKILAKGKSRKLNHTYDELLEQLATKDMEEAVKMNQTNDSIKIVNEFNLERDSIDNSKELIAFIDGKFDVKSEILMIIKTIAIRTQDAHALGYKTHQELTQHIIELILKL